MLERTCHTPESPFKALFNIIGALLILINAEVQPCIPEFCLCLRTVRIEECEMRIDSETKGFEA